MTDLETRLRDAMHAAVPEQFDTSDLAVAARRQAISTRRLRRAAVATGAAVVVAVVGVGASGVFRNRAAEPAVPSPSQSRPINPCPELQSTISPLGGVPASPLSERADAVLVCALVGGDSVWPGSLPPDEAVVRPATLDLLNWRLASDPDAKKCGDRPHGPAFTVSVRDRQGQARTYLNTDLLCDGWVFLDSYYVGLAEQSADWSAALPPLDDYPTCPSALHDPDSNPVELPKGTVLASASSCTYPAIDPLAVTSDTVPTMLYPRRGPFGERDLALLNASLARTGTTAALDPGCNAEAHLPLTYVLRAVTTAGQRVWLTSSPQCLPHFHVNGQRHITIVLDPPAVDAITGPLDRFP
ncbi:hypothetical protein SAMN04489867_2159 [Pedococcus dokdonensis]|uniref:Uncharacterized protein n=1 Tax=Pedococcus dokdonensis TaxID=443156 RepID=A0A1H0S0L9_9MICO|nr:hypothetical protein [Pedococcus dokdonensis]SDP35175.1 hypothetical protein SAMN04489867_2159 [Pedococcus dokdonensis]